MNALGRTAYESPLCPESGIAAKCREVPASVAQRYEMALRARSAVARRAYDGEEVLYSLVTAKFLHN